MDDDPGDVSRNAATRDVIVIGGSAGALEVLQRLLGALPRELPASVFITLHRGHSASSDLLVEALAPRSALPVVAAEEGRRFEHGIAYVATQDRHLLVGSQHLHVRRGPKENRARPAIDVMFRSAAVHCSTRVIAVLLSGMLDDGTAGLAAVKRCGGIAIVQDPRDTQFPDMPSSAIRNVAVDHVAPVGALSGVLRESCAQRAPPPVAAPEQMRIESLIAAQELMQTPTQHSLGELSPITCPECYGVMTEIRDGDMLRYRCHTGHAYTAAAVMSEQREMWERTLYEALRIRHEQAALYARLLADARGRGRTAEIAHLEQRSLHHDEDTHLLRRLLEHLPEEGEPGPRP